MRRGEENEGQEKKRAKKKREKREERREKSALRTYTEGARGEASKPF